MAAPIIPVAHAQSYNPTPLTTPQPTTVNLDRLACAVRKHETADFTAGAGVTHNNGYGIMYKGTFVKFKTREASTQRFIEIWRKGYGAKFPTLKAARVYSGNDRAQAWLANVTHFYNNECA